MRSNTPSWWFQPNPVDKYACKNKFIFPNFRGENEKCYHHLDPLQYILFWLIRWFFLRHALAAASACRSDIAIPWGSGRRLENNKHFWRVLTRGTLQGINISHLGKRKIIFKMPFWEICSSLEGNLSLFMKPLVLELESEYSNLMFSSHQLRLASGRLPIDLSPKHIDYNHPGCFPYQKVKPIYSWWFQFNPFEKICNRQIGSFPQTFGMKIPKIFELPPPRKLMYVR